MDIICEHCNAKLSISDNKIPKGKKISFPCPKCKGKIHIIPEDINEDINSENSINGHGSFSSDRENVPKTLSKEKSRDYNADDKPFDFLDEDAKSVIVCVSAPGLKQIVKKVFKQMEYRIISVNNASTAATRMKYHIFDYIILSEDFDEKNSGTAAILYYIQKLNMEIRRKVFVVLLSRRYRTADNMSAFHESVNLIINEKDLNNFRKIFLRSVREHEKFYSVFNDSVQKKMRNME